VRTSRAIGLPNPLPDIWGIAFRILGGAEGDDPAHDDGDLLFATTGSGPIARHLLVPVPRPSSRLFTTLFPFESAAGERFLLAARPTDGDADASGDRLELLVADLGGPWRRIGEVVLAEPLNEVEGQALRFAPWNPPASLRVSRWLNDVRRPSYLASQRARPDTDSGP